MEDNWQAGSSGRYSVVGRDAVDPWLSVGITQGDERRAGGSSIWALKGTGWPAPHGQNHPLRVMPLPGPGGMVARTAPGPADRLLTRPAHPTRRFGR